jgi:hypothetical protein
MRSRIYRWYEELEAVERKIQENYAVEQTDSVSLSFSKELYLLRLHIEMLRNELLKAGGRK